jgi:hypothetical protein
MTEVWDLEEPHNKHRHIIRLAFENKCGGSVNILVSGPDPWLDPGDQLIPDPLWALIKICCQTNSISFNIVPLTSACSTCQREKV